MIRRKGCPCRPCVPPKRHPGCHDHCEEYAKWAEPILQQYTERREDNTVREIRAQKIEKWYRKGLLERKRHGR